ncbi:MAG: hypothetical protein IT168_22815, partial [Bryobacterales bacterium]|nr:hypothetical protein [Bryobacterales bacterium]
QWIPGQGIVDRGPQLAGPTAIAAITDNVWSRQMDVGLTPLAWVGTGGVLVSEAPAWLSNELYIVGRDGGNSIWWYRSGTGGWTNVGLTGVAASEISAVPR